MSIYVHRKDQHRSLSGWSSCRQFSTPSTYFSDRCLTHIDRRPNKFFHCWVQWWKKRRRGSRIQSVFGKVAKLRDSFPLKCAGFLLKSRQICRLICQNRKCWLLQWASLTFLGGCTSRRGRLSLFSLVSFSQSPSTGPSLWGLLGSGLRTEVWDTISYEFVRGGSKWLQAKLSRQKRRYRPISYSNFSFLLINRSLIPDLNQ